MIGLEGNYEKKAKKIAEELLDKVPKGVKEVDISYGVSHPVVTADVYAGDSSHVGESTTVSAHYINEKGEKDLVSVEMSSRKMDIDGNMERVPDPKMREALEKAFGDIEGISVYLAGHERKRLN